MLIILLHKYGEIKVIIVLSIIVAALSGAVSSVILAIFQGYIDLLGIVLSIGLPLIMAPILIFNFSSLLIKLETARKELEKEHIALINSQKEIKSLTGLLPICASCKKIRDSKGYWNQIESYIQKHSEAEFSHGLCEACSKELYGNDDWYKKAFESTNEKKTIVC
jgi:hypothetical protein